MRDCKDCIHYQMCGSVHIDAYCVAFKNKKDFTDVTRCKDCWYAEDCDGVLYCNHFNHNVYEDDFCSNGG